MLTPDEIFDAAADKLLDLNLELGDDSRGATDRFSRMEGLSDDLEVEADRRFLLVPVVLPQGAGSAFDVEQLTFQLEVVYGMSPQSWRRQLRDAKRIKDAMQRLVDVAGITRVSVTHGEPVQGEDIAVSTWQVEVDYRAADIRRPRVEVTSPRSLATGVDVGAVVEVRFSTPMSTGSGVALVDQDGDAVAHTATWSSGDRVVTLTPTAPLAASTIYVCTVSRGATSAGGHPIREAHELRFATAQE